MEQNTEPRINPCICGELIYDKGGRIYNRERIMALINGVWKTGQHMQKNETGPLSYTIDNNQLKMD